MLCWWLTAEVRELPLLGNATFRNISEYNNTFLHTNIKHFTDILWISDKPCRQVIDLKDQDVVDKYELARISKTLKHN